MALSLRAQSTRDRSLPGFGRPGASVHNFSPVRSVYRWQGEIYERTEGRASLHTRMSLVSAIVDRVKASHPYEVPGISARPIVGGNPDYLEWIADETSSHD